MNAYELADIIEDDMEDGFGMGFLKDAVSMLRQQADRIAELEKGEEVAGRFYWENVVDGHVMAVPSEGTPHYNKDDFPLYTAPQIKQLSDEEIELLQAEHTEKGHFADTLNVKNFARAIIKKASEK